MLGTSRPPIATDRILLSGAVWLGLAGAALANQRFLFERVSASLRQPLSFGLWGIACVVAFVVVFMLLSRLPMGSRLDATARISLPPAATTCFAAISFFHFGISEIIFVSAILLGVAPIALWLDYRGGQMGWAVFGTLAALAFVALLVAGMAFWMLVLACVFLVVAAMGVRGS